MLLSNYALSTSIIDKSLIDSIRNTANTPLQADSKVPLGLQEQHLQNFWGRWRKDEPEQEKQSVSATKEDDDTEWEIDELEDGWGGKRPN